MGMLSVPLSWEDAVPFAATFNPPINNRQASTTMNAMRPSFLDFRGGVDSVICSNQNGNQRCPWRSRRERHLTTETHLKGLPSSTSSPHGTWTMSLDLPLVYGIAAPTGCSTTVSTCRSV